MRVVRWIALGTGVVLAGATLGFVASLLRPRRYADIEPVHADGAPLGRG